MSITRCHKLSSVDNILHQAANYTYRTGQVLYTTDRQGQRRAFNLYSPAGNIIAARQYCSSSNFQDMYVTYISDIRGSIASIVDDGMNFIQGYRYTDYGITKRLGSGVFNEFAYTQGVWDEITGLYYLNARFYNPVDGRFLTQDPYRGSNDQPDTWHLYGYCAGDPVNWIDPSGNRREVIRLNQRVWRHSAIGGLISGRTQNQWQVRARFQRVIVRTVGLRGQTTDRLWWDMIQRDRRHRSRPVAPCPNGSGMRPSRGWRVRDWSAWASRRTTSTLYRNIPAVRWWHTVW